MRLKAKAILGMALALALAALPAWGQEGEAAKPKKPRAQPKIFTKADQAQKEAEKFDLPVLVVFYPEDAKQFAEVRKLIFKGKMKRALDEFMRHNMVVLEIKLKPGQKDPKKVNLRALKDAEKKLLENFGVDEKKSKKQKQQNKDELKPGDMANYPAMVMVQSDFQKELFRVGRYDATGGPGVWLMGIVDQMRTKGIEPVITPRVQPIMDQPMMYAPAEKK